MGFFTTGLTLPSTAKSTSRLEGGYFPFFGWGGGKKPVTNVTYKSVLTLSAVWNAVDIISSAVGLVPFGVYEKIDGGGRTRLEDHEVDWMLNQEFDGPDGILTPYLARKILMTSLLLRGNTLFRIKTDGAGKQRNEYIPWDDVQDIRENTSGNGKKFYSYHIKGGEVLLSHEVLHFRAFSFDGVCGMSFIKFGALSMGIAIEVQNFSYANAQNKGTRQGVIETDKLIAGPNGPAAAPRPVRPDAEGVQVEAPVNTDGGKRAIVAGWRAAMQEKDADRVVVLDEGMKFKPIAITPQEAQLIEQGKFSIEDGARWLNIPVHKLKSLDRSTNNNIEHQSQEFLTDTVQPHVTNIEQEFTKKLLSETERKAKIYIKGNMDVLLRSDIKSRALYYSAMVNSGILTVNEVREKEEKNPKEGGDDLRFPVNTQTQEQIEKSLKDE